MSLPFSLTSIGLSLVTADGGPWVAASQLLPGTVCSSQAAGVVGPCGEHDVPSIITYELVASGAIVPKPMALIGRCLARGTGGSDGDILKKGATAGTLAPEVSVAVKTTDSVGKQVGATITVDSVDYALFDANH